jgi:hypothetical protein
VKERGCGVVQRTTSVRLKNETSPWTVDAMDSLKRPPSKYQPQSTVPSQSCFVSDRQARPWAGQKHLDIKHTHTISRHVPVVHDATRHGVHDTLRHRLRTERGSRQRSRGREGRPRNRGSKRPDRVGGHLTYSLMEFFSPGVKVTWE